MAVLKNDFLRLHLEIGIYDVPCLENDIPWPPYKKIVIGKDGIQKAKEDDHPEIIMTRINMSELTDEQADCKHLARGAEYKYLVDIH